MVVLVGPADITRLRGVLAMMGCICGDASTERRCITISYL